MNRRQMMVLSGAAVAAGQGLAQVAQPAGVNPARVTQRAAYKTLLKFSRPKSSYKIPKNDAKRVKYLDSLSAALALTPDQQQQAGAIFTNAQAARSTLRGSLKAARQNLSKAVKTGDTAAIDQMSAALGTLKAQRTSTGANANAALFRILNSDQQAKLAQFQS